MQLVRQPDSYHQRGWANQARKLHQGLSGCKSSVSSQDALQKENVRLAEANHVLNTQLASSSAQREKLQSRWAERERLLGEDLTCAKVPLLQCHLKGLSTAASQNWLCSGSASTSRYLWILVQAEASRLEKELRAAEKKVGGMIEFLMLCLMHRESPP
jgi:hypothetical protein